MIFGLVSWAKKHTARPRASKPPRLGMHGGSMIRPTALTGRVRVVGRIIDPPPTRHKDLPQHLEPLPRPQGCFR